MAKKKKEVELPEREALESLAKEMNDVMGLDPKIKFNRKTTDEELIEMIKENAIDDDVPQIYHSDFEEDEDDPEKDVFSDEAKETLEALEIEIGDEPEDEPEEKEEKPAKKSADKKKGKKDEEEEEEKPAKKSSKDEEEEEDEKPKKGAKKSKKNEEEEPEEEEKPTKKSSKKSKDEEEEEEEKPAKKSKGADKAEKPAKKREKSEKFTRYMAVAATLKEGKALTEEQIAEKADDLYSKKGGNSGVAQSERIVDRALQLLRALALVEEKNEKIKYTGE